MAKKLRFEGQATSVMRRVILQNHKATYEDVLAECERLGLPSEDRPKDKQHFYATQYVVKTKYGLNSLDDIPRKPNGDLNVSGLIRLLLKRRPSMTQKQVQMALEKEGIAYSPALYKQIKRSMDNGSVEPTTTVDTAADESPDENQHTGPRPRFVKHGQPTVSSSGLTPQQEHICQKMLSMQGDIDALIAEADQVRDADLVDHLRRARRTMGKGIWQLLEH